MSEAQMSLGEMLFEEGYRWDRSRGRHLDTVRQEYGEIFSFFDPDELSHDWTPPAEMQSVFEECFPYGVREGRLKLALHPWWKLVCAFEYSYSSVAKQNVWRPVMIFNEQPVEGEVPKHLDNSRGIYDICRGRIGNFKVPTRADFEDLKLYADRRYLSQEDRLKAITDIDQKKIDASDSEWESFTHDMNAHYFADQCREANRIIGGMQGLPFVPGTSLETLLKELEEQLYDIEIRETASGEKYKVKTRKKSLESAVSEAWAGLRRSVQAAVGSGDEAEDLRLADEAIEQAIDDHVRLNLSGSLAGYVPFAKEEMPADRARTAAEKLVFSEKNRVTRQALELPTARSQEVPAVQVPERVLVGELVKVPV